MYRTKRHLLTIPALVTAAAMACDRGTTVVAPAGRVLANTVSSAPAQTTTQVITFPVDFESPPDACINETIHFTGTIRIVSHLTNNRGVDPSLAVQHQIDNLSGHLDGVGETTGAAYSFEIPQHVGVQTESPTAEFPFAFQLVFQNLVTSPGRGAVELVHGQLLLVENANGELVVNRSVFSFSCK